MNFSHVRLRCDFIVDVNFATRVIKYSRDKFQSGKNVPMCPNPFFCSLFWFGEVSCESFTCTLKM